jgi:predicted ATP-binding protein involved in virulence
MKGTPEQITAKKAARIRSNVRQFFQYYREQLEQTEKPALKEFNRAELQALETVQAETLQALENMTDPELLASKTAYGDRALIDRITARAERIRRTSKQIA